MASTADAEAAEEAGVETTGVETEATADAVTETKTTDAATEEDTGTPGDESAESVKGALGSWDMGGTDSSTVDGDDYDYSCALYITADGLVEANSNTSRIESGTYDGTGASDILINDNASGHTQIVVNNADYTISDATIKMMTDADGTDTCDFSGKGSAVAVFGSDAEVTIENSDIHTAGVATMPVFTDDGATVTVKNSTLQSDGGTLYAEYMNTPSQTLMVAPPWVLGIMGNSRCTNLMGTDSTMNVIDSETSSGAWAVLSTDAGSNMALNIYNSSLTLNNADESQYPLQAEGGQIYETKDNPYTVNYGSGYGTYVIGKATETFAGAEVNVGTYATIFTGGSARFCSLKAGEEYEMTSADGSDTVTYTATEDKNTVVNSDTFGFMAHKSSNTLAIEEGTEVNSAYATFLIKTGSDSQAFNAAVDSASINNGGVLIQIMDNDDTTNGGKMDADDPDNTNGGSQNFKQVHYEDAGFNTDQADASSATQQFTFTDGTYSGNIYNASGSDGLEGSDLYVTLGSGAVLNGAAASTSAVHVTYDGSVSLKQSGCDAFDNAEEAAAFAEQYQNTEFDITEYWSFGHVANLVNDNGANGVYITLTDDAVWNVDETSLIQGLSISGDAKVVIPAGVTLTVGGVEYTDCTLTAADEIEAGVTIPEQTSSEESGHGGPGGSDGESHGGPGGDGSEPPQRPDR